VSLFPNLKFYIHISLYILLDLLPSNATYRVAPSSIEYLKYPSKVVPLVVTPTQILPNTMLIVTSSNHSYYQSFLLSFPQTQSLTSFIILSLHSDNM